MPTVKEFNLSIEDKPGTLGKICRALADKNVNIVAAQSFSAGAKSLTRLVFDDPTKARPLRTASAIGVDATRPFGKPFSEVADVPGWEGYEVPELDEWR